MTVVVGTLAGAGLGLGLYLLVRALIPGPAPLAAVLAARPNGVADGTGMASGVAGWAARAVAATGAVDAEGQAGKLRVLGKPVERHAAEKLAAATAGLLLPVLAGLALWVAGVAVRPGWVTVASVVLAVAGFFYPDLPLAEQVEQRRRAFRHALSAYLDLVTVLLAGAAGLETALQAAADSGEGWAFDELRHALGRARLANQSPWESFDRLGRELGVDELRELAASARLAAGHGARIQASLSAKADSMRDAQTAQIEAAAENATEKMLIPVAALVVGMILFIGYGVVEAIGTPTTVTPP